VNLQALFSAPILEQTYLDPGYSGHASDVWRVRTAEEVVVVRMLRQGLPEVPFWYGCHVLFGLDQRAIFQLEPLNRLLARFCSLPVPQVLRKGTLEDRPYVIVDAMPGVSFETFSELPEEALEAMGEEFARLHCGRFDWFGTPTGSTRYDLADFQTRLQETLRLLVERFYQQDEAIKKMLPAACEAVTQLPPLHYTVPVLMDMDASQFLTDGKRITAFVDTEGYAMGPRELDFIGLEYVFQQREARAFARGYERVLSLPEIAPVRFVYRYLYCLMEVQGSVALDPWMRYPALFA
jgi:fructosamine-3-kinase